ncbi:hypothetical protein SprV_0100186600 [Sparganum proliferum]
MPRRRWSPPPPSSTTSATTIATYPAPDTAENTPDALIIIALVTNTLTANNVDSISTCLHFGSGRVKDPT